VLAPIPSQEPALVPSDPCLNSGRRCPRPIAKYTSLTSRGTDWFYKTFKHPNTFVSSARYWLPDVLWARSIVVHIPEMQLVCFRRSPRSLETAEEFRNFLAETPIPGLRRELLEWLRYHNYHWLLQGAHRYPSVKYATSIRNISQPMRPQPTQLYDEPRLPTSSRAKGFMPGPYESGLSSARALNIALGKPRHKFPYTHWTWSPFPDCLRVLQASKTALHRVV
jgi:hypothetical protein